MFLHPAALKLANDSDSDLQQDVNEAVIIHQSANPERPRAREMLSR